MLTHLHGKIAVHGLAFYNNSIPVVDERTERLNKYWPLQYLLVLHWTLSRFEFDSPVPYPRHWLLPIAFIFLSFPSFIHSSARHPGLSDQHWYGGARGQQRDFGLCRPGLTGANNHMASRKQYSVLSRQWTRWYVFIHFFVYTQWGSGGVEPEAYGIMK